MTRERGEQYILAKIEGRLRTLTMRVSIILGSDQTSRRGWDRLSKDLTLNGVGSSWEGEVSDSIFELGAETYVGAKREDRSTSMGKLAVAHLLTSSG